MNLALSPLCSITPENAMITKWKVDAEKLYGHDIPAYLKNLESPMREQYETVARTNGELLSSLTQVDLTSL